ncbi:uncharacterized protein [Acropora muricata]|uniref:uncharacterized protein isoform X2 n=1 Tax=Acropora muricata TaxID=159855 RepID=UPI0034E49847
MEFPCLQAEEKCHGERRSKKRKSKDISPGENEDDYLNSALQKVSTCFGVGGLYITKERKIENTAGCLVPLRYDWNPGDKIQMLSTEMKQRFGKEMSEISFQLLCMIKQVSQLFKELHEGENFLKDIAMDIFLKDMDTRSPLPLPNSYVEIGVWKQVMQINQHNCGKMEQFTKMNQGSIDEREMVNIGEPSEIETAEKYRKSNEHHEEKSTFHDYYMDMITANFGDDLDHLRKEGSLDSRKIEMLINCLETGKDIWSDLEKSLLQYETK